MYKVNIPKILFLALEIAKHYKKDRFYNTNDLAILANEYGKELVRLRVQKKEYKYLDDTNFGGLRGNFSTLMTWKGLVRRGTTIVNNWSVGRDDRILNAVINGRIILDLNEQGFWAHTKDEKLKSLLELESWLLGVREEQAHIKVWLSRNPEIPLTRDNANFAKVSVVKSNHDQYFIRALLNNYSDYSNSIIEYDIKNLWEGNKLKKKNLHLMLVVPSIKNAWDKIFYINNEQLLKNKPLTIYFDTNSQNCYDAEDNNYNLFSLDDALSSFSTGNQNVEERLEHNWKKLERDNCTEEIEFKNRKHDEFSEFLNKFLGWKNNFSIEGKKVINIASYSSGGPDVSLFFEDGSEQKIELEHTWKSYLEHRHNLDNAWSNVWLFAEEPWNSEKVYMLFKEQKKTNNIRIPNVFLCIDNGVKKAYRINWVDGSILELDLDI